MSNELVLPFYVLADVSYSMTQGGADGVTPLEQLNRMVPTIKDALDENPILGDKVRFSLLDFSDDCRTQIPLCNLMAVPSDSIPTLTARGGTSFAAAFTTARQQIDSDHRQLKADGHQVHRPTVFFLTDGEPTDPDLEWRSAHTDLVDTSFRAHPNIVPFGVGTARKDILDQVSAPAGKWNAFIAAPGTDPAKAIRSMAELLIGSIVASASSISEGGTSGGFVPPDPDDEPDIWI
jgi:uncharacterized protein YegL